MKKLKYEEIRFVLQLIFRDLKHYNYTFTNNRKEYLLNVLGGNNKKCNFCDNSTSQFEPFICNLNMTIFQCIICFDWSPDISNVKKSTCYPNFKQLIWP